MSAAIVYDGVPGAQGTLFQGLTFYVRVRVPNRPKIIDLITQNGGQVVKWDNKAQYVIADPKRPDNPSGMFSFQFIEDSVKYGAVQEEDKYLIDQSPRASRPVGSSMPVKGTRNAYTETEDALLAKWVLSHPKGTRGNEIYKELARRNDRHPWQSWRDRWVKQLSRYSATRLQEMAAAAPELMPPAISSPLALRPEHATQSKVTKSVPPAPKAAVRPPSSTTTTRTTPKEIDVKQEAQTSKPPMAEAEFTEEDDELLLRSVSENEKRREIDAGFFQELGKKHTCHPWESWRHRWFNVVEPQRQKNSSAQENSIMEHTSIKTKPETSAVPPGSSRHEITKKKEDAGSSDAREKHASRPPAANVGENQPRETPDPEDENEEDEEVEESQDITRDVFYRRLKDYREILSQNPDTEIWISDRLVDLWDLWRAVRDVYAQGGVEVDWEEVAEALSFSREDSEALLQCYSDHLIKFVATWDDGNSSSNGSDDDEEQIGVHGDKQSQDQEEGDDLAEQAEDRVSPMIDAPSRKRQATPAEISAYVSASDGQGKRRRRDPDTEIPSTPDDKLGLANLANLDQSPLLGMQDVPQGPAVRQRREGDARQRAGKSRRLEPETQDFGFDDEEAAQEGQGISDEFDILRSQQHRREVQATSPLPLSLSRHKSGTDANLCETASLASMPDISADDSEEEPESQGASKIAELEDIIKRFEAHGYPRNDILTALMATSLCTPLTDSVLKHMRRKGHLPRDWEGVWTERDDERLRRVDSAGPESDADGAQHAKMKKYWDFLVLKHTQRRIEQRREFLAYMDEIAKASQ